MSMSRSKPTSYRARWVLPVDRPPIQGGVVTIGDGSILAVAKGGSFEVDLGEVVLAPGFVNVHAHLDLSDSTLLKPSTSSFADWLLSVVQHRRTRLLLSLDRLAVVAEEMKRLGTAVLGDLAQGNVAGKAEAAEGLAGVTFGEVIGLRAERYQPLLDSQAQSVGSFVGSRRLGISPHAPYSTAAQVYQTARQGPRCTHWLESPDEVEFLRTGSGPLKTFLEEIGAWPESAPKGRWYGDPWAELLGDPSEWLLVHANFTTEADLEHAMKLSNGKPLQIAYCPRTHAAFGFNEYPLEMFVRAGCVVGLGTDSLASNPDLDVFQEAVFVAERFPQFADERLLRMLTLNGAKLLGCDADYGSLSLGKPASVVMLQAPGLVGRRFDWRRFFSKDTTVVGWLGVE
jgi:cytosine/adenosine deaminase-related metal-dependent hydrolase